MTVSPTANRPGRVVEVVEPEARIGLPLLVVVETDGSSPGRAAHRQRVEDGRGGEEGDRAA